MSPKLLHWLVVTLSIFFAVQGKDPDCYRNTQEMAEARGYLVENFTITTEDGYKLKTFRIYGKKGKKYENGIPVLMLHGILGSSDNLLDNGDGAVPYALAEKGYDVWLMNNRGNRYSREHVRIDPDRSAKFWEYSFHEIGLYDVVANMELILNKTKHEKIAFVGYSQGASAILAAYCLKPEFFKKHLRSIVLWAPVSNMQHSNQLLRLTFYSFAFNAMEFLGIRELFSYDPVFTSFTSVICRLNPAICSLLLAIVADMNPFYDNQEKWEVILSHYPVGTSVLSLLHILELHVYKSFSLYKKSVFHDLQSYDLSNFDSSVPVAIMTGKNDKLVNTRDAQWLGSLLRSQNALKFYREYDYMGHITFVIPSLKARAFQQDTVNFIMDH